jgi:hypothetical protein
MKAKKKKFPDLTGDGKVTQADIVRARIASTKKQKAIAQAMAGGAVVGVLGATSKVNPKDYPTASKKKYNSGGKVKSRVNEAGNYTKPGMRKRLFNSIKAGSKGGNPGQWSARKAQLLASRYKKAGGGYKN